MRWRHIAGYALQRLKHDKQRVAIAVLAVAFGVMSLTAMSTLAQTITRVLLVDPRLTIGGDAQLWRDEAVLSPESIAQIEALHEQGVIERYALVEYNNMLVMKTPDSGQVTFLRRGMGIDPQTYPLLGEVTVGEPAGASLADVLAEPWSAVVTQDIAEERGLSVGDTILVTNRLGGTLREMHVAGIATGTPGYEGELIYYSLETARRITGFDVPATDVLVIWSDETDGTIAELSAAGWVIYTPESVTAQSEEIDSTFGFALKGAGILGLMVGGIGIANTMQVMLARRREEIAILKTLGYSRRDMIGLFVLETGIIGLFGSLLGVLLSIGLSVGLVAIVGRVVTLFFEWQFDPVLGLGGLVVGVVTTVLFAMNAILEASDVRPADIFRHAPQAGRRWWRTVAVYATLAIPFAAITSIILKSVLEGVGILLLALGGLIGLGLLLGGTMWVVLRLLPTFRFHLLRMARNNMRRRGFALIFAMIALFVGVFTLGLSITTISSSMDEYARRSFSLEGINLVVLADPEREAAIRTELARYPVENINTRYQAAVESIVLADGSVVPARELQGRDGVPWDVTLEGRPWGSVPDGVYLPLDAALPLGSELIVTGVEGAEHRLTVVGTFSATVWEDGLLAPAGGLLVSKDVFLDLSGDQFYFTVAGEAPVSALTEVRDAVGRALPETMVITSLDIDGFFSATLKNLFTFAAAMAGLAFLAGGVLIANAVSLAMIERQYEIGILKAVGYARGRVLRTILLEYGLIATIASLLGLAGVEGFIVVLQKVQQTAGELLHVTWVSGGLIVLVSVGLTLGAALAVAWRPTQVRPGVLLRAVHD
jgi:putative ABC transport system permease protein